MIDLTIGRRNFFFFLGCNRVLFFPKVDRSDKLNFLRNEGGVLLSSSYRRIYRRNAAADVSVALPASVDHGGNHAGHHDTGKMEAGKLEKARGLDR